MARLVFQTKPSAFNDTFISFFFKKAEKAEIWTAKIFNRFHSMLMHSCQYQLAQYSAQYTKFPVVNRLNSQICLTCYLIALVNCETKTQHTHACLSFVVWSSRRFILLCSSLFLIRRKSSNHISNQWIRYLKLYLSWATFELSSDSLLVPEEVMNCWRSRREAISRAVPRIVLKLWVAFLLSYYLGSIVGLSDHLSVLLNQRIADKNG